MFYWIIFNKNIITLMDKEIVEAETNLKMAILMLIKGKVGAEKEFNQHSKADVIGVKRVCVLIGLFNSFVHSFRISNV